MLGLVVALSLVSGQTVPYSPLGPVFSNPAWIASPAFSAPSLYTSELAPCSLDSGCVLACEATASAWTCTDSADQPVTVTNAAANGFEGGPFYLASGQQYVAKDLTDATAPYIAAATAQTVLGANFWIGDHTVYAVAAPTSTSTTTPHIVAHGLTSTDGFVLNTNSSGLLRAAWSAAAANTSATSTLSPLSRWVIASAGRSGSNYFVRHNGAESAAVPVATTSVNPLTKNLYFGRGDATTIASRGPLYRVRFYATAHTAAQKALVEARLTKGLATRPADTYVTTVRPSAAYDLYNATLIAASGDNLRIPHPTKGLASFASIVNLALQRRDLNNASWSKDASVATTPVSASCPMSRISDQRMNLVDNTLATNTGSVYQLATVASSTGPFTAAFDVATTSGTGTKTVTAICFSGNATVCTCVRDDGGACVTSTAAGNCIAKMTASTTPVRLSATVTCSLASTAFYAGVAPGDRGTATGTACYDLAQASTGSAPLPYCDNPTQTAAATCAADTHTIPKPNAFNETEGCAKVCITPSWTGAPVAAVHHLNGNTAGSARFAYSNGADANIYAFNGSAAAGVAAGYVSGVTKCYLTEWSASANFLRITNQSSGASGSAAFTAFPAFAATVEIGSLNGGTLNGNSHYSNIVLGRRAGHCR